MSGNVDTRSRSIGKSRDGLNSSALTRLPTTAPWLSTSCDFPLRRHRAQPAAYASDFESNLKSRRICRLPPGFPVSILKLLHRARHDGGADPPTNLGNGSEITAGIPGVLAMEQMNDVGVPRNPRLFARTPQTQTWSRAISILFPPRPAADGCVHCAPSLRGCPAPPSLAFFALNGSELDANTPDGALLRIPRTATYEQQRVSVGELREGSAALAILACSAAVPPTPNCPRATLRASFAPVPSRASQSAPLMPDLPIPFRSWTRALPSCVRCPTNGLLRASNARLRSACFSNPHLASTHRRSSRLRLLYPGPSVPIYIPWKRRLAALLVPLLPLVLLCGDAQSPCVSAAMQHLLECGVPPAAYCVVDRVVSGPFRIGRTKHMEDNADLDCARFRVGLGLRVTVSRSHRLPTEDPHYLRVYSSSPRSPAGPANGAGLSSPPFAQTHHERRNASSSNAVQPAPFPRWGVSPRRAQLFRDTFDCDDSLRLGYVYARFRCAWEPGPRTARLLVSILHNVVQQPARPQRPSQLAG
ncbi:hypothetical protein C8R44DRAFT_852382 [Mycena epipterygia]|nr:hypothetical protein C8R44DRAFT_852382 [Mycena epipterygia]